MIIVDFDLGITGHDIIEYAKDFLEWYDSDIDKMDDYECYYDDYAVYLMEKEEADDEEICYAMYSVTAYFGNCFSVWYDERSLDSVVCKEYEEWLLKQEKQEELETKSISS